AISEGSGTRSPSGLAWPGRGDGEAGDGGALGVGGAGETKGALGASGERAGSGLRVSSETFVRMVPRDRREIAFRVSNTPTPWRAAASKSGAPPGLSFERIASSGAVWGRSRL